MLKVDDLKGLTRNEIIKMCIKNGYKLDKQDPRFFGSAAVKDNPLIISGIKATDYVRFLKFENGEDEILIVDIFNGLSCPLSDADIVVSKLYSSELRMGIFLVGYVGEIPIK